MDEKPDRLRAYVSFNEHTYDLFSRVVRHFGVKPSIAASIVFAVGAKTLVDQLNLWTEQEIRDSAFDDLGMPSSVPMDAEMLGQSDVSDGEKSGSGKKSRKRKSITAQE